MTLRFIIFTLRLTLGILLWIVVTTLFGRGRISRSVWRSLRLVRRVSRL